MVEISQVSFKVDRLYEYFLPLMFSLSHMCLVMNVFVDALSNKENTLHKLLIVHITMGIYVPVVVELDILIALDFTTLSKCKKLLCLSSQILHENFILQLLTSWPTLRHI